MNKNIESIDQYEACNRILKYVLEKPNVWISPIEIQKKFLSSVPIQKVAFLFDLISITFPEPVSVQRNINENFWEIRANEYTNEFLIEGGFINYFGGGTSKTTNVLFLSASPSDEDRIRVDLELRNVEEQLESAKYRDMFNLEKKVAVKIETITKALLDFEPQIVHFAGHGNEQGILIENDSGNSSFFPLQGLEKLFTLFRDNLNCVILNSCYSENQAEIISRQGIYVIGMKESIPDNIAIEFSKGFYQGLGAGKDIEFSYKLGLTLIAKYPDQCLNPILWKNGIIQLEHDSSINT